MLLCRDFVAANLNDLQKTFERLTEVIISSQTEWCMVRMRNNFRIFFSDLAPFLYCIHII